MKKKIIVLFALTLQKQVLPIENISIDVCVKSSCININEKKRKEVFT